MDRAFRLLLQTALPWSKHSALFASIEIKQYLFIISLPISLDLYLKIYRCLFVCVCLFLLLQSREGKLYQGSRALGLQQEAALQAKEEQVHSLLWPPSWGSGVGVTTLRWQWPAQESREHNSWVRSSGCGCISELTGGGEFRLSHPAGEAPSPGWNVFGTL